MRGAILALLALTISITALGYWAGYDFWLAKMNQYSLPGEDVTLKPIAFERV